MGDFNIIHAMPWTGAYAIYFFTIGISAALFFFSALSWFREPFVPVRASAAYASFALLVASGLLLVADLSQPMRFLNTVNPAYMTFTSPLAWGALNLLTFGIASVVYLYALRVKRDALARRVAIVGSLLALGLPVYTGFDLTVHQNRPVWNTPLIPILFVALSLVSGAAVAILLALRESAATQALRGIMLWSAGAVAVMLVSILGTTAYGGTGAELTFLAMTEGTMGLVFIGVGILAGTALPIALMLAPMGRRYGGLALASVLLLVGGLALRYSILVGGQLVQLHF